MFAKFLIVLGLEKIKTEQLELKTGLYGQDFLGVMRSADSSNSQKVLQVQRHRGLNQTRL